MLIYLSKTTIKMEEKNASMTLPTDYLQYWWVVLWVVADSCGGCWPQSVFSSITSCPWLIFLCFSYVICCIGIKPASHISMHRKQLNIITRIMSIITWTMVEKNEIWQNSLSIGNLLNTMFFLRNDLSHHHRTMQSVQMSSVATYLHWRWSYYQYHIILI